MSRDTLHIALDEVIVSSSRRPVDDEAVKRLAASIKEIGLQHPITVRSVKGQFHLVAGRHRLEAHRRIGSESIQVIVARFDSVDAEMWEISENLHRAELSALQRAENIDRWRFLKTEKAKVLTNSTPSGGEQPKEAGVRKTAEELGVDPAEVSRSRGIAALSMDAKQAAVASGLDTSRSALLHASRVEPEHQASVIREIADHKASKIDGDIAHRAAVSIAEWIVERANGNDLDALKANLFATTSKAIAIELTNLLGQSIMDRRYA